MTNTQRSISFLQLAGKGNVDEAFSKFVAHDFIHHNQYFEGTRDALASAMADAHQSEPNNSIEVKKSYVDGDTIVTHSLVCKVDMDIIVIHIFRFKEDMISELWDIGQVALKDSPNSNGHF